MSHTLDKTEKKTSFSISLPSSKLTISLISIYKHYKHQNMYNFFSFSGLPLRHSRKYILSSAHWSHRRGIWSSLSSCTTSGVKGALYIKIYDWHFLYVWHSSEPSLRIWLLNEGEANSLKQTLSDKSCCNFYFPLSLDCIRFRFLCSRVSFRELSETSNNRKIIIKFQTKVFPVFSSESITSQYRSS